MAHNFLLNSDVKFCRKISEAILAIRIDATYPKDKILELYLNEIFLGENSYGVAAAALNYFGKSLDQLDIAEVAFLAALPKGPAITIRALSRSRARPPQLGHRPDGRQWLHHRRQAKAAKAEPLVTQIRALGSQAADADYFVEEVRRQLYKQYGEQALYDGGLQVRASLDTRLQNYAVNALRTGLVRYDRRHGWRGAENHLDVNGDWKNGAGQTPPINQSGIDTWRIAVVLGLRRQSHPHRPRRRQPPADSL